MSAVFNGRNPEELGLPLSEHRKDFQRQDPIFEGLATEFPGVMVLDPTVLFVSSKHVCRVTEGGKALYFDNDHLTIAGAMVLRPLFVPLFEGMGKSPATVRGKGVRRE